MFDQLEAVAVIWWTRDDYPRMLEIMIDAHKLPSSFEEWEELAEDAVAMISDQGCKPIRVETRLDHFIDYCRARGLKFDGRGRSRFAADPGNWPLRSKH